MLPAFKGRINRKTFIFGNMVGLAILGFAALIYIIPLAIIDIVVNSVGGAGATPIFKVLYALFAIPAIFYFFYFAVLFVKRLHDIGYPGMLLLWSLILLEGIGHLTDFWIFNILGFLLLAGVCVLPGQKARNNFGPKPAKKFKKQDLVVKF